VRCAAAEKKEKPMGLKELREGLAASLIERDGEIDALLLGLVAREHVLFISPPGCAKTQLAMSLAGAIQGANVFVRLLDKFTTPEELFGPLKLSALKADRYERAIAGYAPTAHIILFDEPFKASTAILNTTLTLLQERQYDNGGIRISCPLRVAIGASNEVPSAEEGRELSAVFDRFLIRRMMRPIAPSSHERLMFDDLLPVKQCATLTEIDAAAQAARLLPISGSGKEALLQIVAELNAAGVRPSDRRMRKAVGVARAAAMIDGAAEVQVGHLEPLADVLWDDPAQADKAAEIVQRIANPVGSKLNEILREVEQIAAAAVDKAAAMAAVPKLEKCKAKADHLAKSGNGRAAKLVEAINDRIIMVTAKAMDRSEDKVRAFLAATK